MGKGIFGENKNMAGATPFGRGRYAVPGKYMLELRAFSTKESQDPSTKGNQLLIAEFSVMSFEPTTYESYLDGKTKSTERVFKVGDTLSEVVDTDDRKYGLVNSKELCAAVKHAVEIQRNNRADYSVDAAMAELSNDEANGWVTDPDKNKNLIGLVFKLEAWNVSRTNSQTKKPDDFTAKRLSSGV